MAIPQPDPMPNPWGLPVIPPSPPASDDELGLTTSDDGDWDWVPPKPDDTMPFGQFLCILIAVPLLIGRYLGAKARLQYGINRWRI